MKRRTLIKSAMALTGLVAASGAGLAQLRRLQRPEALPLPPPYTPAAAATKRANVLQRFWHALLERASAPCDIVFVGDSVTEGCPPGGVPTALLTNQAWRVLLQNHLRAAFSTAGAGGSLGYYASFRMASVPADYPVHHTGRIANRSGLGLRNVLLTKPGQYVQFTTPSSCTSVDIFWARTTDPGKFTYQINGSSPVGPIDTMAVGAEEDFHSTRVIGVSGGKVLKVSYASGASVNIDGFFAYNGDEMKGIRGWDASQTGVACATLVAKANRRWFRAFEVIQPALVIIEIGANDAPYHSAAQLKENLLEMIGLIKARCAKMPSIIVLGLWPPNFTTREPWENYNETFRSVAAIDDAVWYFDLRSAINKAAPSDTVGGLLPDANHPGIRGSEIIASTLFEAIRPDNGRADTPRKNVEQPQKKN